MDLKETVIHEALKLFSLKGFLSTSVQDILEAAHTSKGGLYNHFQSKEDLFFAVVKEAQRVWREACLQGLDQVKGPVEKIKLLLRNYRDHYVKDKSHFPGGCIFVTLSVELDDQRPALSQELNKGFAGLMAMIRRLLDEGKGGGDLRKDVDTEALTELIFAGMLGASVIYAMEKSEVRLDQCINALVNNLETLTAKARR